MTRVVKPDELGDPDESLREQMRKLDLHPQGGEATHTHTPFVHTRNTANIRAVSSRGRGRAVALLGCTKLHNMCHNTHKHTRFYSLCFGGSSCAVKTFLHV